MKGPALAVTRTRFAAWVFGALSIFFSALLHAAPQAGWWWNPAESGRGFFLEWQGGQLLMAGYMYDDNGNPVWYLSSNSAPSTTLVETVGLNATSLERSGE